MASSPDSKHQAGHEGAGHTQEADVLEEALAVGCAKLLERLESGERGGVQMQNWAQRSNVWVNAGVNLKYMCASAFICRLERELKSQEVRYIQRPSRDLKRIVQTITVTDARVLCSLAFLANFCSYVSTDVTARAICNLGVCVRLIRGFPRPALAGKAVPIPEYVALI